MCEIQEDVLEKLKCIECDNYLSYPPILLKTDGNSLCGRCSTSVEKESKLVRNNIYELVAEILKFPCRNKEVGCSNKCFGKDMKSHEENCSYRKLNCLFSTKTNCEWNGYYSDMKNHLREEHKDMVASNPYNTKLDVTKDIDEKFLISEFGVLFFARVKFNAYSGTCLVHVKLLDKPEFSSYFEYIFGVTCKDNSATKKHSWSEDVEDEMNINLSEVFASGEFSYNISIKLHDEECKECKTTLVSPGIKLLENGCYCNNCPTDKGDELLICERRFSQLLNNQGTQT